MTQPSGTTTAGKGPARMLDVGLRAELQRAQAVGARRQRRPRSSRSSPASTVTCTQMCGVLIGPEQAELAALDRPDRRRRAEDQLDVAREVPPIVDVAGAAMAPWSGSDRAWSRWPWRRGSAGRAGPSAARACPSRWPRRQASITCRSGTPQRRASGSGRIRSASASSAIGDHGRQPLGRDRGHRGWRPAVCARPSRRARAAP